MHIQKATAEQLPQILPVYEQARAFMAACGNGGQWANGYPSEAVLRQDIARGHLYLCLDENALAAVFCFRAEPDPTYAHIYNGRWPNGRPYGVIHRLAVMRRGKGTASFCLQWALRQSPDIRIDTHADNIPMQKVILKNGFAYCGVIYTDDGTPRRAYQFSLPDALLPARGAPQTVFKRLSAQDYGRLLPLLLEADPCEDVVKSYFPSCHIWVYEREGAALASACVLPLSERECELKNLAVRSDLRAKGVGAALCRSVFSACKALGFTQMDVGTADVPGHPGPFYQKLGFCPVGRITDFFTKNYPAPVYDGSNLCRDLLLLRRPL